MTLASLEVAASSDLTSVPLMARPFGSRGQGQFISSSFDSLDTDTRVPKRKPQAITVSVLATTAECLKALPDPEPRVTLRRAVVVAQRVTRQRPPAVMTLKRPF